MTTNTLLVELFVEELPPKALKSLGETFGRGLILEPYFASIVLGGGLLRRAGSDALRGALVPRIAAGKLKAGEDHSAVQVPESFLLHGLLPGAKPSAAISSGRSGGDEDGEEDPDRDPDDGSEEIDEGEREDVEQLERRFNTYGVGVRAGAITPQMADEEHFRAAAGLRPMSDAAKRAWEKDKGARRPVTLAAPEGEATTQPNANESDE